MTRLEALKSLLAKVEAGEWDFRADAPVRQVFPYNSSSADDLGLTARAAFEGSLDAAKALHEAVLPGWVYGINFDANEELYAFVGDAAHFETDEAYADTPARAWLIAILKALIAKEEG